jgi:hypothetical protein
LVFLGRQEAVEVVVTALGVIDDPYRSIATTMVEICEYFIPSLKSNLAIFPLKFQAPMLEPETS